MFAPSASRASHRLRDDSARGPKCCISAQSRHTFRVGGRVAYEHMFATLEGTVDQALERRREARRREVRAICEQQARLAQRLTQIVREADDDGDWHAAGCSSSAQWLAQISSSDHRTAARITQTSDALREPACARPRPQHRRADTSTRSQPPPSSRPPRAMPSSRASRSAKRPAPSRWPRARSPRPR